MKRILFWIGLIVVIVACSIQKKTVGKIEKPIEIASNDSVGYELETFDMSFESWYALHNGPAEYRTQTYYEGWNKRYVDAWNFNATDMQKGSFFEPIVGYDPTVDYGFELNHKLFYYFQYVENVLKIQIMEGGPKAVHM
jgi:hypothetical protein